MRGIWVWSLAATSNMRVWPIGVFRDFFTNLEFPRAECCPECYDQIFFRWHIPFLPEGLYVGSICLFLWVSGKFHVFHESGCLERMNEGFVLPLKFFVFLGELFLFVAYPVKVSLAIIGGEKNQSIASSEAIKQIIKIQVIILYLHTIRLLG